MAGSRHGKETGGRGVTSVAEPAAERAKSRPPGVSPLEGESSGREVSPAWNPPPTSFYRSIVEGMTCGVMTIDRRGIVTTLNEHARSILSLKSSECQGRPCQEVLASHPRLASVMLESFSMAAPPSRAEMELRLPDGRRCAIGFSISMIEGALGGPSEGAALFFKDLTRVEEQEERERLRDRLAVLGEMAAQMAHEIRTPLTAISVSTSLMKRRLASRGESPDLLDKIAADAARIEATIAGCLEYARPLTPGRTPVRAAEIIDEALEAARTGRGSENVRTIHEPDEGTPFILCDRAMLKGALVNIFNNAFEAMRAKGGTLTVSARPVTGAASSSDRLLYIRISDTGPGIPHELCDRIFHPFFTTKTSGSGIGLAMARKVVESHGGWIDVESEPGQGATFVLRLPVAP